MHLKLHAVRSVYAPNLFVPVDARGLQILILLHIEPPGYNYKESSSSSLSWKAVSPPLV